MAKFQIFKDKAGEYRWRLRANNNEIIASVTLPCMRNPPACRHVCASA